MHGVSISLDCLTRYVDRVRDDVCALNMLSTLLERQNLIGPARTALIEAQKLLGGKEEDQNFEAVHLNLGRWVHQCHFCSPGPYFIKLVLSVIYVFSLLFV